MSPKKATVGGKGNFEFRASLHIPFFVCIRLAKYWHRNVKKEFLFRKEQEEGEEHEQEEGWHQPPLRQGDHLLPGIRNHVLRSFQGNMKRNASLNFVVLIDYPC